jgi:hypothetical protein
LRGKVAEVGGRSCTVRLMNEGNRPRFFPFDELALVALPSAAPRRAPNDAAASGGAGLLAPSSAPAGSAMDAQGPSAANGDAVVKTVGLRLEALAAAGYRRTQAEQAARRRRPPRSSPFAPADAAARAAPSVVTVWPLWRGLSKGSGVVVGPPGTRWCFVVTCAHAFGPPPPHTTAGSREGACRNPGAAAAAAAASPWVYPWVYPRVCDADVTLADGNSVGARLVARWDRAAAGSGAAPSTATWRSWR